MITRKGLVTLSVVLAGATVAAMAESWPLAIGFLPLALGLLAALAGDVLRGPLHADVEVAADRAVAGDVVRARIRVPATRWGLSEAAVELPETCSVAGGAASFLVGPSRDPVDVACEVSFPARGRHALPALRTRRRGVFGLFAQELVSVPAGEVVVHPPPEEGPVVRFVRRARVIQGDFRVGRVGAGQEFFGLRALLPGDAIDVVNWRKTALFGRPIVNEFEHESPADVVVALDCRAHAAVGAGASTPVEAGIRATLALAAGALADGYKVGVLTFGHQIQWTYPASGRRRLARIVDHLVDVRVGGWYGLDAAFISVPPNFLPAGAHLVLVAPKPVEPALAPLLETLAARNVAVTVVVPRAETCEVAADALGPDASPLADLLFLAQERAEEALRAAGVHVVGWDVRDPFPLAWQARPGRPQEVRR